MASADYLNQYAEGWTTGDFSKILGSLADSYTLDDPNSGTIVNEAMSDYLVGFQQQVESMGGNIGGSLLELTEIVTQEEAGILTAWAWWSAPGTGIEGAGLIKVGDAGVLSERLTYHTKLSEG